MGGPSWVFKTPCRIAGAADRLTHVTATTESVPAPESASPSLGAPIGRIPVANVSPVIEGGAYPAKAVLGESIPVRATVFREGHDAVNASIVTTDPDGNERLDPMQPTTPLGFDWWTGEVTLDDRGRLDLPGRGLERPLGDLGAQRRDQDPGRHRRPTWSAPRARRSSAPRPSAPRPPATPRSAALLRGAAKSLRLRASRSRTGCSRCWPTTSRARWRRTVRASWSPPRPEYPIFVDRRAALFASWYEFFPRSAGCALRRGERTWISGTFDSSHERLEAAAAMGFDVVYLPPIHPIGTRLPQGPEQHPRPRARPIPARRGRSATSRAATTPSIPTSATSTPSTGSWPRPT